MGVPDADVPEAAVRQATAERDQAADSLHRLEPLLPKAFATREQVDEARTKVTSLDAQVAQANEKLNQARVAVSSLATLQAQRPGAVAALGTAQLDLSYTRIYAPFDGQVVGQSAHQSLAFSGLTNRADVVVNADGGGVRRNAEGAAQAVGAAAGLAAGGKGST